MMVKFCSSGLWVGKIYKILSIIDCKIGVKGECWFGMDFWIFVESRRKMDWDCIVLF